ncbi:Protein kinase rad3 [Ceratobasidium theobromae]|uniref:Protein kinase rad3 n=1 Tax=Ceratobasidium theobromae TaxID=1582974 RepID=A0A5N5Q9T7_9AGAM|nr:Protein kinase rad3 [Ceratobasidium theobromae]
MIPPDTMDLAADNIERLSQVLSLTPEGDELMPKWLNELGNAHLARFEQFGEMQDIQQAVELQERAIMLTPAGHSDLPTRLTDLAIVYRARFERLGQVQDIDKAIEYETQALLLTPESHAITSKLLNALGNSHMARYDRLGLPADLDGAIEFQNRAIMLTRLSDANLPRWLHSLGSTYQRRFDYQGHTQDIDMAIELQYKAVSLVPESHPAVPMVLNSLGLAHSKRFQRLDGMEDISKAIECQVRAVSLLPDGNPALSGCLAVLGGSYNTRFERLGNSEDIENAIECLARAMSLLPEGHPVISTILLNLGSAQQQKLQHLGDPGSLAESLESFQRSALSPGHPLKRLDAACRWGKLAVSQQVPDPLAAFETAMSLVPQVVRSGNPIHERFNNVKVVGDLASEAAASAISAQRYDLAIEWLEQGRAIVWNQVLQLQAPLDGLESANPPLARALEQVASELYAVGFSNPLHSLDLEQAAHRHRRLAQQYEQLVQEARFVPGFERFLLPKKASELVEASRNGPVVVVTVHSSRSDALVLRPQPDGLSHIDLQNISLTKANELRAQLERSLSERDRSGCADVLATLWTGVAKPVLEHLGYLNSKPGGLPRVTWCMAGLLASLPIHAAGLYDEPQAKVSDFVISSYTPTLGALMSPPSPANHSSILAVGQPSAPEQNHAPGTESELAHIKQRAQPPVRFTELRDAHATTAAVLGGMETHDWVHLACRIRPNAQDPTASEIFLHNGSMRLAAILQKSFRSKGLAFLSACDTLLTDSSLADECMHPAFWMLLAGYPSVISSMWSANDQDVSMVADRVYDQLLKDGKMNHRDAASALHDALEELRVTVGEGEFWRWIPFVHIGV